MSELWSVRVANKQDLTIELTVRQVHPDAGPFPHSAVFALRVLWDGARKGSPLAKAFSLDDIQDDEMIGARVADHVAGVRVEVERPSLDMAGLEELLRSRGVSEDELESEYQDALMSPKAKVAGLARYIITVTDARWTAGVARSWDSASYFTPPALFSARVKKREGDRVEVVVRQRHVDAPGFGTSPVFAARLLLAGPAEYAEGAPEYQQIQDDAYMAAHVAEHIRNVSVAVVRPPIDLAGLRELRQRRVKMRFSPKSKIAGKAIYTVSVASEAWLSELSAGEEWNFSPRS